MTNVTRQLVRSVDLPLTSGTTAPTMEVGDGLSRRPPRRSWIGILRPATRRQRTALRVLSFVLPLIVWTAVSYVPFIWHPLVQVTDPGGSTWLQPDMRVSAADFANEVAASDASHVPRPKGKAANPIYLPAPHEVAAAFWTQLTTSEQQAGDGIWLPSNLWHSIQIIVCGFVISSIIGVPLGVLCGAQPLVARLAEPVLDFARYMPAPAFGALMVAILGIYDGPKIAIVVIGVFFNQVLIIGNATRSVDPLLIEAALTMGSRDFGLVRKVIVPAVMPQIFRAQRILLGSAWTYLIVAELIGQSSGITFFISQQARYQHFDNVFAAIIIIGILGSTTDILLAFVGKRLFPYDRSGA